MNTTTVLFNKDLNLQFKHSNRIKICFDIINGFLPKSGIYLFGSYAKREIKEESDIDILVLIEDDLAPKELQEIRWKIEDALYEVNNVTFEIDLKLYPKKFYENQLALSHFFIEIEKYKRDLRCVRWS